MAEILCFACDPGGANIVKTLAGPFREAGHELELWGREKALDIFAAAGLAFHNLDSALQQHDLPGIDAFLDQRRPEFVLTGTSGDDFSERFLWASASRRKIPSMAVLDQWINYGLRFSPYTLRELALYRNAPSLPYLPDIICVMDQLAMDEMIAEGVPRERIVVTGQPYLETVHDEVKAFGLQRDVQASLGIPSDARVVLFVSEPLSQAYGREATLGYTEQSILRELLLCLEELDGRLREDIFLILKLHPKESPSSFDGIVASTNLQNVKVRIEQAESSRKLLAAASCVIGMGSTLLIEAALCGKPIVSVQIGGHGSNPLMLCRRGSVEPVTSAAQLGSVLEQMLLQPAPQGSPSGPNEPAAAKILQLIQERTVLSTMRDSTAVGAELAINGGPPTRTEKFPATRTIGAEEQAAAQRVLASGVLSRFLGVWHEDFHGGPEVQAFEREWADHFNVKHAIAVNSATSGLYAAIGAAGIEPGDEVIVSPYTMAASAVAPLVYSAIPVFADIEAEFFCLDPASVRASISERTRAIIVVDIFGLPYDAEAINAIAAEHNLVVIEDCAQAPGAYLNGKAAGTLGDIGIYSLNYHKHIHTGEGGVVVTNDDEIADKLRLIRNHAESVVLRKGYQSLANMIGFNYRMTELEAAIGREQLKKLDSLVAQRQRNVEYLSERLAQIPAITPALTRPGATHVYYQHPLLFDSAVAGVHRDLFVKALQAELPLTELRETEGVKVGGGYVLPIYLQPAFQERIAFGSQGHPWTTFNSQVHYPKGMCPRVEAAYSDLLITHDMMRPPLTRADLDDVVKAFTKVWSQRHKLVQARS